jgi:hypothetical protein
VVRLRGARCRGDRSEAPVGLPLTQNVPVCGRGVGVGSGSGGALRRRGAPPPVDYPVASSRSILSYPTLETSLCQTRRTNFAMPLRAATASSGTGEPEPGPMRARSRRGSPPFRHGPGSAPDGSRPPRSEEPRRAPGSSTCPVPAERYDTACPPQPRRPVRPPRRDRRGEQNPLGRFHGQYPVSDREVKPLRHVLGQRGPDGASDLPELDPQRPVRAACAGGDSSYNVVTPLPEPP